MKIIEKIDGLYRAVYEKITGRLVKKRQEEEKLLMNAKKFLIETYKELIKDFEREEALKKLVGPKLDKETYYKGKVLAYFLRSEDASKIEKVKEILGRDEYKELSLVYSGEFGENLVLCFSYLPNFGDEGEYRKKIGAALNELNIKPDKFMAMKMTESNREEVEKLEEKIKHLEEVGPTEVKVYLQDNF